MVEQKVVRCTSEFLSDIYDGCRYNKELFSPDALNGMITAHKVLAFAGIFHSFLILKFPRLQILMLY
jgi:hypothetical protein